VTASAGANAVSGSRFWRIGFRVLYRLARFGDPLIRSWIASDLPGFGGVVEVTVEGRRSGRARRILVTLIRLGDDWYVGHPNGDTAWTRNAEASGVVRIDPPSVRGDRFSVERLPAGAERDGVTAAAPRQQFFPANLVYRAAAAHVAAVGVYFRVRPL
jgi:hypothetical protein